MIVHSLVRKCLRDYLMDDALQCMQTDLRVIFIVNFEQISHIVLIFPFWTRECPLDRD